MFTKGRKWCGEKMREKDNDGHSAKHFTNKRAQVYDNLIRQVVPGYDVLHKMSGLLLRTELADDARLLVVGSGTASEIEHLAHIAPGWQFTGVEPAVSMNAVARERLAEAGLTERAHLVDGYVTDLGEETGFDAALMLLVMHFVDDDGGKANLLNGIAKRLKPGSPLVLADLHADVNGQRFSSFLNHWRNWQLSSGMPEEQVEKGFNTLIKDVAFVPEDRILELLHQAGFRTVEPFFGAYLFGAWIAWKE